MMYVHTGSGLRLSISPRGTQIKTVDSGIIFTCVVVVDDSTETQQQQQQLPVAAEMRWVGPDLQYVSNIKGSRYIRANYFTASAEAVFDVHRSVNQQSKRCCRTSSAVSDLVVRSVFCR